MFQFNGPYVLISGSYQINKTNDTFCDYLGTELAKHRVGVACGGGVAGLKVAESMDRTLTEIGEYDPAKLVIVYRKKQKAEEIKVKRIGCALFFGDGIDEMRHFLFSKASAIIVIGGSAKTKDEILLAQKLNFHIIPVGMSGGTAYSLWQEFYRTGGPEDRERLLQLNSKNTAIAAKAVMRDLTELFARKPKASKAENV